MFVDKDGYFGNIILNNIMSNYYYLKKGIHKLSKKAINTTRNNIYAIAKTYLKYKKYNLSLEMFHWALYKNGKDLSGETLRFLKTKIRNSKTMNSLITNQIKKANSNKKSHFFVQKTKRNNLEFKKSVDPDLYYSIQHPTKYLITGNKDNRNNKWEISIIFNDIYDFTDFGRTWREGVSVGHVANDFGVIMQKAKIVIKYNIMFRLDYKVPNK